MQVLLSQKVVSVSWKALRKAPELPVLPATLQKSHDGPHVSRSGNKEPLLLVRQACAFRQSFTQAEKCVISDNIPPTFASPLETPQAGKGQERGQDNLEKGPYMHTMAGLVLRVQEHGR